MFILKNSLNNETEYQKSFLENSSDNSVCEFGTGKNAEIACNESIAEENRNNENLNGENVCGETNDDIYEEEIRKAKEAKEAKKMKFRKILYPIAIILIILLWVSGFTEKP